MSDLIIDTTEFLTRETSEPFTRDPTSDHIATTLNYFMAILAGPGKEKMKTKNPKKYKFQPKKILLKICECYLNLSGHSQFVESVAKDERSFKKEIFFSAVEILLNKKMWSLNHISRFKSFVEHVAIVQSQQSEEIEDVPDHFLDPLMDSLMTDPVKKKKKILLFLIFNIFFISGIRELVILISKGMLKMKM